MKSVSVVLVVGQINDVHSTAFITSRRATQNVLIGGIVTSSLRYDGDFVIDSQGPSCAGIGRARACATFLDLNLLLVENFPSYHRMSCIDMILKEFVHCEGGCANGALVREMRRFQTESVVLHYVAEQFPLMNLKNSIIQIGNYLIQKKILINSRTLPHIGHLPPSWPRLAASCIEEVTSPWDPNKCLSSPWSVKNRHWHF